MGSPSLLCDDDVPNDPYQRLEFAKKLPKGVDGAMEEALLEMKSLLLAYQE
jgi:hypothetical protein